MISVIGAALGRPRTVLLLLALVLATGSVAYVQIPKEAAPDISIPIVYVSMSHDGISPGDAERLLIRPMERELRSIEGVKEMSSSAYEGGANVLLEFDAGFDADAAMDDVRAKVDLARPELPDDTDEPRVHEVNLSLFPVIVVTLSGDVSERALLRLARELQDAIEAIPSVLEANIAGDREELVEIVIDPMLVESYGLDGPALTGFVARSNRLVAAGALDTGVGRFGVKVPGLLEGATDLLDLPLKVEADAVTRLRDVATIRRTFRDPESFARVAGRPALALEVSKRTGENIIETIDRVRGAVRQVSASWPPEIEVAYTQDSSDQIRSMLGDLQNNVLSAVLLVMIVMVWALGWRLAALVGVAIPGSFLAGILLLSALGFTMNMVVLFSLILAVGMLVDGAVIVNEYADRKMAEGLNRRKAYFAAASRMAWPITASTLTTLAAFLPLMFWPGVVGEFMKFLPITLSAALAASLAMALIFVPTLGSLVGKPRAADAGRAQALALAGDGGDLDDRLGGFTRFYVSLLRGALAHPGKVVLVALALLVGVQIYYVNHGNGIEFFPRVEPDEAAFQVHARGNLSVLEKDALVREVEERILDMPEFATVYTRTGSAGGSGGAAADVIGSVTVELVDWERRRPAAEIFDEVRRRTADLAGVVVEPTEERSGPASGKPIRIQVGSRVTELIAPAVAAIRAHMDTLPALVDVEDSRPLPGIEWEIEVDRAQAAKFGTDVSAVGGVVRLVTNGLKIGTLRPDDSRDEIGVRVRFPDDRRTLGQLDRLRIETPAGQVPVANFVNRWAAPRSGTISRVDGMRVMTLEAEVAEGVLVDNAVRQLASWVAEAGFDPRLDITFRGENESQAEAAGFLTQAFAVALFIMAMILVTQFNSFYSAFLILSAVVMSTIGVMIGLLVTGKPFGIVMSGIGVIALAGVVVNNNIVLIDTYDRLKTQIGDPMKAILLTGAQRLRPVLLTAVTTVLGLMPMVLETNIDFIGRDVSIGSPSTQWWVQLASAIVFGLSFATVLTLVFTPCALMLKANVAAWLSRRRRRRGAPVPATG